MRTYALSAALLLALGACDRGDPPASKNAASESQAGQAKAAAEGDEESSQGSAREESAELMDECPGKSTAGHSCSEAEPGEGDAFGTFSIDAPEKRLSAVASELGDGKQKVKVSGKVDSVCRKKGCWMVLEDGDVTARVFTHEGGFFVPTSTAKGREAVVEGELEARTMSEKLSKHLAADQGRDPEKVDGPKRELVMQATAVALR